MQTEDIDLSDFIPDVPIYTFGDWLQSTAELQERFFDGDPADLDAEGAISFITWNALAAHCEITEMLQEIGWKPWASSRHINREDALKEIVDVLHFLGNILRTLRVSGKELTEAYREKQTKNALRMINGYDGVKEKCGECGREK